MRRLAFAILALVAIPARAASVWQDDTDGNGFACFDVGTVQVNNLAGSGTRCVAVTATGELIPMSVPCAAPLTACTDYVSVPCQSGSTDIGGSNGTTTVVGVENTAAMRGDIVVTEIAAPGTPASGKLACYADNLFRNWNCKDQTGVVNHGVRTQNVVASNYVTGISDSGFVSTAQPAFSDLNGSATCSQLPALTGDTITSAGSCSTKVVGIHESGGLAIPIGACTTDGQAFVKVAGSMTCRLPGGDLSNDYTAPWVTAMHDGASVQHATTGTWGGSQVMETDVVGRVTTSNTLACLNVPVLAGDVNTAGGTCTTVVANLPNDVTQAGDILAANAVTPGAPSVGHARTYTNSFGNLSSVNSAGVVNHGIQTNSCSTHQWINAIADPGNSGCSQPAYSDLSGTPPVTSTLPYAFVFLAITNTGELISGGSSPTATGGIGITRTEYPMGFAFNNVTLKCYLVNNHITSGTYTLKASRDSVDTTASLSFTSSTTTGLVYTSGPVSIGSPSAADTYGLDVTAVGTSASCGSGLCPSDIMCTVVLTP